MSIKTTTITRCLVAVDIDGTLVDPRGLASPATRDAIGLARAAGHELILATGRSLAGLLPVARHLGLTDGWAVASNGALLVRLDPTAPSGCIVQDAHLFDTGRVIGRARALTRDVVIAVEDVGLGWRVSRRLPDGALNGPQTVTSVADLCATPATRLALVAPGIRRFTDALTATGTTITAAGPDWLDVVAPGVSKATTLDQVRRDLHIPTEVTVAVGDGMNDCEMLTWAGHGVAMGHAPARVRHAADETTGTLADDGAATLLRTLVPASALDPGLTPLAAQLAAAAETSTSPTTLRVWHGAGPALTSVTAWLLDDGPWRIHAPIPAGTGATMRDVENAATRAGLHYPAADNSPRARWRTTLTAGPRSYELPLYRG